MSKALLITLNRIYIISYIQLYPNIRHIFVFTHRRKPCRCDLTNEGVHLDFTQWRTKPVSIEESRMSRLCIESIQLDFYHIWIMYLIIRPLVLVIPFCYLSGCSPGSTNCAGLYFRGRTQRLVKVVLSNGKSCSTGPVSAVLNNCKVTTRLSRVQGQVDCYQRNRRAVQCTDNEDSTIGDNGRSVVRWAGIFVKHRKHRNVHCIGWWRTKSRDVSKHFWLRMKIAHFVDGLQREREEIQTRTWPRFSDWMFRWARHTRIRDKRCYKEKTTLS